MTNDHIAGVGNMVVMVKCDNLIREDKMIESQKSQWGDGPWQHEPDRFEWVDEATGYHCCARKTNKGHWYSYIALEYDNNEDEDKNIKWCTTIDLRKSQNEKNITLFYDSTLSKGLIMSTCKDLNSIKNECTNLARQLKEVEKND